MRVSRRKSEGYTAPGYVCGGVDNVGTVHGELPALGGSAVTSCVHFVTPTGEHGYNVIPGTAGVSVYSSSPTWDRQRDGRIM